MSNYHGKIMDIQVVVPVRQSSGEMMAYKLGHRDARHAAAEIAAEADARIAELESQFKLLLIFAYDLHDIGCNGYIDPDLLAMRGVNWVTSKYPLPSRDEIESAYQALENSKHD